jgi:hypothetical protein
MNEYQNACLSPKIFCRECAASKALTMRSEHQLVLDGRLALNEEYRQAATPIKSITDKESFALHA